jgi:hypothetical protein
MITVFMGLSGRDRKLLGSMEINGTLFLSMPGNEYGMRHTYIHIRAKGISKQKYRLCVTKVP